MTMKTAVGSLVAPVIALLLMSITSVFAEAATYDMTGTWDYQFTDCWSDCPGEPALDQSGTLVISQSEDVFNISVDEGFDQTGVISGSRYQVYSGFPSMDMIIRSSLSGSNGLTI